MALLRKRFSLFGPPFDHILFDYINGTKYPSKSDWLSLFDIVAPLKCRDKSGEIPCTFFRGTNWQPSAHAQIKDVIDQSDRFFSWTDSKKVAEMIAVESRGVLLTLKASNIAGIDLRRVNSMQREVLLPPSKYVVSDVQEIDGLRQLWLI